MRKSKVSRDGEKPREGGFVDVWEEVWQCGQHPTKLPLERETGIWSTERCGSHLTESISGEPCVCRADWSGLRSEEEVGKRSQAV